MPDSKAHPMKHLTAWCDKCRATLLIIVPREHTPKCCPMCRRKFTVEKIRYV